MGLYSVPNPASWSSGPVLVPQLRSSVGNAVGFLAGAPLFMGYNTTGQSIPSGANTQITLDTEAADTWGMHVPPAVNVYARAPGWYLVCSYCQFAYTGTTVYDFTSSIVTEVSGTVTTLQGEQAGGGSGQTPTVGAADLVRLVAIGTAADCVSASCRQDTGGSVNLSGDCWLSARWVAATTGTTGLPVPSNPAWPEPPSYVTSSFLNANITEAIQFLAYPPIFRGYYSGSGQQIANQTSFTGATISLDTYRGTGFASGGPPVDNYSGWSSANSWWVVPVSGLYSCYGQVAFASAGSSYQLGAGISVNGTVQWGKLVYQPSTSVPRSALAVTKIRLAAGQTVALAAFQNTGDSLGVTGSSTSACFSKLIIIWECA